MPAEQPGHKRLLSPARIGHGTALALFLAACAPAPIPPPDAPATVAAAQPEPLPPPAPLDEMIVIPVAAQEDSSGTAIAITDTGHWITARHLVENCDTVSLLLNPEAPEAVRSVELDPLSDLALLLASSGPAPVRFDLASPLLKDAEGYMTGFPQGRAGEINVRLKARARLMTRGAREVESPLLTWAETDRPDDLKGVLTGLSGGPVYDAAGHVRGVIVAESTRKGAIYTASPESVSAFLASRHVTVSAVKTSAAVTAPQRLAQTVKVRCEVNE